MSRTPKVKLPVAPLPDLMRWWRALRVQGVVIGGLAVALLGRPRVTRDVDALVLLPEEQWPQFLKRGHDLGFVARHPDTLDFAKRNRVLLLRHDATEIEIDISLGNLPFELETVQRAQRKRVAGVTVPLATAEDIIVMKAIAHRERDLLDIAGLLESHPKLDLKRIRYWVGALAALLEMPEIGEDLERLFARQAATSNRPKKSN